MAALDDAARAALMLAEYNRPRGPAGPTVAIDRARADLAQAIAGRNAAEAEADRKRRAVANAETLLEEVEDDLRRSMRSRAATASADWASARNGSIAAKMVLRRFCAAVLATKRPSGPSGQRRTFATLQANTPARSCGAKAPGQPGSAA